MNRVITIFRPDRVSGRLVCLGTVPAWVHKKDRLKNDDAGTYRDDRFDIRVSVDCMEDVRVGDLVFFGRAESSCVEASECHRIEIVTENREGTAPHWHLASEYKYR